MLVRCNGCFETYDDKFGLCPYCGYVSGSAPSEVFQLYVGTLLADRYIIGNVLGFGGFGITYKAWDTKLDTAVAIKEYYPSGLVNRAPGSANIIAIMGKRRQEFQYGLKRFLDEAKNMSKFNTHKNIVNIFEYFEENNTAYIVMEFLDGCTLSQYMHERNDKLSVDESLQIIESVCSALDDIHKVGIIHRDVSPDNIYICKDGTVKLIDFGAARFSTAEDEKKYSIILKPGFAPPEQYEQISAQGPWTDIYALGATLYYMVTGQKPEESTNRRISDKLKEPSAINPQIPKHISLSIMKAMAIDRHMRFSSVADFHKAIKQEKKVVSLKKERNRRKAKRFTGVLAGVLIFSLIVSVFSLQMDEETLQPAEIDFWYIQFDGVECEEIYTNIVNEFVDAYDNVTINAVGIPEEEYYEKLSAAIQNNTAPDVFQSTGASSDILKNTINLSQIVYPQSDMWFYKYTSMLYKQTAEGCKLLYNYDEYFPQMNQVPTSFNVPVVYVNTAVTEYKETTVSDLNALKSAKINENQTAIMINEKLKSNFAEMFGNDILSDSSIRYGTVDDFAKGDVAFYISDTSDFYTVRSMGTYEIKEIDNDNVTCEFHDMWSVSKSDENSEKASKRFIEFLLSYNAQNQLYGSGDKIKAIPINEKAIESFSGTFKKIGFVFDDVENFKFKQIA